MAKRSRKADAQGAVAVKDSGEARYAINFGAMEKGGKSPAVVVSSRVCGRCEACMKFSKTNPAYAHTTSELMKQIAAKCSREPAYLLPGTPVTEAVFRLMLASGNRPMTVAEVQGGLTQAWASVIYLKNLSDEVVTRMLQGENEYFIGPVGA